MIIKPGQEDREYHLRHGDGVCACCGRPIRAHDTFWVWHHRLKDDGHQDDGPGGWLAHTRCLRRYVRGIITDMAAVLREADHAERMAVKGLADR